jgi:putative SOS response-associated peptidase YedK
MPVILVTGTEVERWLEAETPEALALQRPVADDALRIVAKGERSDEPISLNWTDPHRDLERLRAMRGPTA